MTHSNGRANKRPAMRTTVSLSRRGLLQATLCGMAGIGASRWMPAFAEALAADAQRKRHCVLLWMAGGPSQTDTFDMKPGHANGGEFQEIETSVPGLRFSEHLPRLARLADHLAVLRGMSTAEGDHGRGTYLMHTGRPPEGPIRYPTIGSAVSKELADAAAPLPGFVTVAAGQSFNRAAFQPGFLGPRHAPLAVRSRDDVRSLQQIEADQDFARLEIEDLGPPAEVGLGQAERRARLLQELQSDFAARHSGGATAMHQTTVERAIQMIHSDAADAFDLTAEPAVVREKYGRGRFGQGCLLGRRLIERGVPFIEVVLGDQGRWDTHTANFPTVASLSGELDAGWASLMEELDERGLLESTTILWMGEFGRTPRINGSAGRDHFPQAWTSVLAGGGINGGQAYGRTDAGGMSVVDGALSVDDVLATLCGALGVNPRKQNISEVGRPIRIVDGKPVSELLSDPMAARDVEEES
ncbi:hypothetical protein Mal4_18250 [Maioricimonas rarisocia]|uniref:Sulfatase n=1 Tax=Maioricimonas rarisocia TaxID=2528026 RepID=A0A517Z4U9_9PLAN|nr:DUF1501 domain-containing protein [Maioricimonas rarisocia]QDU37511.1 hypothetical protein Mal4_18250 [Maioricimonas rarisocia]